MVLPSRLSVGSVVVALGLDGAAVVNT